MSEGALIPGIFSDGMVEQYGLLMEYAADYALILLDAAGHVADWNAGAERMFGYQAEEIIGRPFTVFFVPESAAGRRLEEDLHAAAATGPTEHECWYVRKDGGRLWCRGTLRELRELRRENEIASRFALVLRDLTERRAQEEALRDSEERHRLICELTSDFNYTLRVDANGGTMLENVTEGISPLTGFTLEELNGRGGWLVVIHPEDLEKTQRGLRRVLSGEINANVIRVVTKKGSIRWLRTLNTPVWDAAQARVTRIIGAAQDITERRQVEQELRESREQLQALYRQLIDTQENERRRLAHELHDEIGQSLTAIGIHLQAARSAANERTQPQLQEALAIVEGAISQVRHLSLDLRPSVLDDLGLEAALRWYSDRYIRLTGSDIHLDVNLGGRRLPVDVETACFRVAQEALTNVLRHAQARRVWIQLQRRELVELTVRDDGVGFDPQTARQPSLEGVRFGLLGMQERVELLGGEFAVESQPGHGASIRVRFTTATTPTNEEFPSHEIDPHLAGR